jgi:tetratricopeptide (TPR) repeat protein
MILLPLLFALLAFDSTDAGNTTGQRCPAIGGHEDFSWRVLGPSLVKEPPFPGTEAKRLLAEKDSWLRECPRNEFVWYAVLRATELASQDRKAPTDLVEAARAAVPDSVWIETVRARALGTVAAAEAAVRLDPKRIPGQVALAAAYERAGDRESALRTLRPIRDLQRVAGGPLLLARVALALGDAKLAAESAHREPGSELGLIEPVSGMLLAGEARMLEGDARLRLGQADKALSAYLEADLWRSVEASARLCSPTADLEHAMEARLKKSKMPEDLRGRILEYLGVHRLRTGEVASGVHLLVKALAVPNCYGGVFETLSDGGSDMRKVLEKLRADARLPTRERMVVEDVLKTGPNTRHSEGLTVPKD